MSGLRRRVNYLTPCGLDTGTGDEVATRGTGSAFAEMKNDPDHGRRQLNTLAIKLDQGRRQLNTPAIKLDQGRRQLNLMYFESFSHPVPF